MDSTISTTSSWPSPQNTAAAVVVFAAVIHLAYRDYCAWYQLGPGGLPRTPKGWLIQTILKPICSRNVTSNEFFDRYMTGLEATSFINTDLEARKGIQPVVGHWAAPQRQLDGRASTNVKERVESLLRQIVSSNPDLLYHGASKLDGEGAALFVRTRGQAAQHPYFPQSPNEVLHMHEIDGSIHCTLSAADAKLCVQRGWGRRHGLNGKIGFPRGYVFVFAARNNDDLIAHNAIARGAARYGLGGAALQ